MLIVVYIWANHLNRKLRFILNRPQILIVVIVTITSNALKERST